MNLPDQIFRYLVVTILLLFPYLSPAQTGKKFSYAEELEQLYRTDLLPAYRDNCLVEQVSSYDPTGGNEDGFNGVYSFVRKEDGQLVIADLQGPGVINRIWTPTPTNDSLLFYFDGEKQARLRICFNDLFSGKVYPFVAPLCGNEIGGFYSYLPIPYRKSCKVVFTGESMRFYQVQYRNLPGYQVDSFTGKLDEREKKVLEKIGADWANPAIPGFTSNRIKEERFVLKPGEEHLFFSINRGGTISGFEIEDNGYFQGKDKDVLLTAVWDNEEIPAICAPVSDFFGYAFGSPSMKGYLAGKKGEVNYCYLPAPFDKSAVMKLQYKKREGEEQPELLIKTRVYYTDQSRDKKREGKLYTAWRREINPPEGSYYDFLSAKGKGHYIGTIQQGEGLLPEMTVFFEGDDSTYVDGKMRIHGTGSEDYYNGGWYAMPDRWDTGISLPLHGSLNYSDAASRTGGYRFYTGDKLPFEKEFYLGIEHGPEGNLYPVDYTSVAFYYADRPPAGIMYPEEHLRRVPDRKVYRFYPQLLRVTPYADTSVHSGRGITVSASEEGAVKIILDGVAEGTYQVFLSYFRKPGSGSFAVWQRQNLIREWQDAVMPEERFVEREYIGETVFTGQNHSLTIKVKNNGGNNRFEFGCIYLERVND